MGSSEVNKSAAAHLTKKTNKISDSYKTNGNLWKHHVLSDHA